MLFYGNLLSAVDDQRIIYNARCRFRGYDKPEAEVENAPEMACSRLHAKLVSVDAHLQATTLWNEFHSLGTEMILTKAGR